MMTAPLTYKEVKAIMKPEPPQRPDPVMEVRKHVMRAANLYNLCVRAVDKVIAPKMPPIVQTSEMFQSAVASLFIHATRWRLDEKMPDKPINF